MVDVTDRPDVHMGLRSLKLGFRHCVNLPVFRNIRFFAKEFGRRRPA
jgi:hypothetical protein